MRDTLRLVRAPADSPRRIAADPTRPGRPAPAENILYPLDVAYAQAGIAPPVVRALRPARIPTPYRALLVHDSDMTLTLEEHFGGPVALRALSCFRKDHSYFRRVLLVQEYSGRPVEMGAIRIDLDALPGRVRAQVIAHRVPLGRVLRDGGVDYRSLPKVFFSVEPNSEMMGVFWMREPRTLYGRQTEVRVGRKKIGDIVEILPLA